MTKIVAILPNPLVSSTRSRHIFESFTTVVKRVEDMCEEISIVRVKEFNLLHLFCLEERVLSSRMSKSRNDEDLDLS